MRLPTSFSVLRRGQFATEEEGNVFVGLPIAFAPRYTVSVLDPLPPRFDIGIKAMPTTDGTVTVSHPQDGFFNEIVTVSGGADAFDDVINGQFIFGIWDDFPDVVIDSFSVLTPEEFEARVATDEDRDVLLTQFRQLCREFEEQCRILFGAAFVLNGDVYVAEPIEAMEPIFKRSGIVRIGDSDGTGFHVHCQFRLWPYADVVREQLRRLPFLHLLGVAWKAYRGSPPPLRGEAGKKQLARALCDEACTKQLARALCLRRFCRVRGADAEDMEAEVVQPFARDIAMFL